MGVIKNVIFHWQYTGVMSSQKKKQKKTTKLKKQQHKNKQKGYRSSCLGCDTSLDVHIP